MRVRMSFVAILACCSVWQGEMQQMCCNCCSNCLIRHTQVISKFAPLALGDMGNETRQDMILHVSCCCCCCKKWRYYHTMKLFLSTAAIVEPPWVHALQVLQIHMSLLIINQQKCDSRNVHWKCDRECEHGSVCGCPVRVVCADDCFLRQQSGATLATGNYGCHRICRKWSFCYCLKCP